MVIIKEDGPESPWADDSGPDILEIMNDPEARKLLTPANLGVLLTVRFPSPLSLSANQLFASCKRSVQINLRERDAQV